MTRFVRFFFCISFLITASAKADDVQTAFERASALFQGALKLRVEDISGTVETKAGHCARQNINFGTVRYHYENAAAITLEQVSDPAIGLSHVLAVYTKLFNSSTGDLGTYSQGGGSGAPDPIYPAQYDWSTSFVARHTGASSHVWVTAYHYQGWYGKRKITIFCWYPK